MTRRTLLLTASLSAGFALLHGCGAGQESNLPPVEVAPAYRWAQPTVRYRFPAPGTATDIYLLPIETLPMSKRQKQAARDAFASWQSVGGPAWVEVAPTDEADVQIVVQTAEAFQALLSRQTDPFVQRGRVVTFRDESGAGGRIVYGECRLWLSDVAAGTIGRAVVRLPETLPPSLLFSTLLHEAGHGLGLPHSERREDVMYPYQSVDAPREVLSAGDMRALRTIHP